ncbi:hypothetical protein SRABI80_04738 [Peribacillus frigoritolerans]|nr:hypothetical protein SRABI80_04738 [Peribacillus frigoritolerans]
MKFVGTYSDLVFAILIYYVIVPMLLLALGHYLINITNKSNSIPIFLIGLNLFFNYSD